MKKVIVSLAAMVMVFVVVFAASTVNPPANVVESFKSAYSNASGAVWKTNKNGYVATFKSNGSRTTVMYSKAGKFMSSKTALSPASLPENIRTAFAVSFKGQLITEACVIKNADGTIKYEVESKTTEVVYGADAKIIKKEKKGKEEEEDDDDDDDNEDEDDDN